VVAAVAEVPELRSTDGTRLLLPASRLVPIGPRRYGDPTRWRHLEDQGLVSSWDPNLMVTPRVHGRYDPEAWQRQQVHWHGYCTITDPTQSNQRLTRALIGRGAGQLVGVDPPRADQVTPLRTPVEAVQWVDEQVRANVHNVPPRFRASAELDDRLDGDGLYRQTEYNLVQCWAGQLICGRLHESETRAWEVWAWPHSPLAERPLGHGHCTVHR
jgi:hypothetical protein